MNLPANLSEADVLEAIEKAVRILAPSFVFGYHDRDDIQQQARLFGLQALERYDGVRPLANFVYTHIRNRLINFKRDKLRRNDPPCLRCHEGDPCNDGVLCKRYAEWLGRNNAKASIMRPLALEVFGEDSEVNAKTDSTAHDDVTLAELAAQIDQELPVELRGYYLRMRDGISVPKAKRQQVLDAVRAVVDRIDRRS